MPPRLPLPVATAEAGEAEEADAPGADEGPVGTESDGDDAGAPGERDPGAAVELLLRGAEEGPAEAESHRPPGHGEAQVEEVGHRRHRPPDEAPAARHHLGSRL